LIPESTDPTKAISLLACKHRYHWRRTFLYQILGALNGNTPGCVSLWATEETAKSYQSSGWQMHDLNMPHASDCTVESSPAFNLFFL